MATSKDTSSFFLEADSKAFDSVLKLYPQAIKLKAEQRTKKPEELLKLDNWYQNELPKKIKSRGKDAHMLHEELVQLMKWKQARGKFYPQLSYLIKVNTPRAVVQETKKAFKKLPNIESAITALSNLKGVGTATASALLAAANPDIAPFMAEECLYAIPEMEGIDYTAKEYLNFVAHIRTTCDRLNKENGCDTKWSPHMVELALWTHYIVSEMQPELLGREPLPAGAPRNGASPLPSDESNLEPPPTNGKLVVEGVGISEDTTTSFTEDSNDKVGSPSPSPGAATPSTPSPSPPSQDSTSDSSQLSTHNNKRQLEEASSAEESSLGESADAAPPVKKPRDSTH